MFFDCGRIKRQKSRLKYMNKTKFFLITTLVLLGIIVAVVGQSVYRQRQAINLYKKTSDQVLANKNNPRELVKVLATSQNDRNFIQTHKPILNISFSFSNSQAGLHLDDGSGYQGGQGNEAECATLQSALLSSDVHEFYWIFYDISDGELNRILLNSMNALGCVW